MLQGKNKQAEFGAARFEKSIFMSELKKNEMMTSMYGGPNKSRYSKFNETAFLPYSKTVKKALMVHEIQVKLSKSNRAL